MITTLIAVGCVAVWLALGVLVMGLVWRLSGEGRLNPHDAEDKMMTATFVLFWPLLLLFGLLTWVGGAFVRAVNKISA